MDCEAESRFVAPDGAGDDNDDEKRSAYTQMCGCGLSLRDPQSRLHWA
jgi:hypothetical protein